MSKRGGRYANLGSIMIASKLHQNIHIHPEHTQSSFLNRNLTTRYCVFAGANPARHYVGIEP